MNTSSVPLEEDDFAARGFAERLDLALGNKEKGLVARRARIAPSTITKYMRGESEPGGFKVARLSKELGVSLHWLLTGEGLPNAEAAGYVGVPIYDVRLAAGAASFSEAATVVGEAPFDLEFLRSIGRMSGQGLGVLTADGDSMEPTIPDGSRLLVDLHDTRLREGIFAFSFGDELRVKRLKRTADGVEIISDNSRYEPERLQGEELDLFAVIGRILWVGTRI